MFGGVDVWQIAKLKVIGKIKFGKLIDFGHKDTICKLKFGYLKFGKSQTTRQICQTILLPNIPDLPQENWPSSLLVMIVEIPVLKFLIGITSFCSC